MVRASIIERKREQAARNALKQIRTNTYREGGEGARFCGAPSRRRVGVSLAPHEQTKRTALIASIARAGVLLLTIALAARWLLASALRLVARMTAERPPGASATSTVASTSASPMTS